MEAQTEKTVIFTTHEDPPCKVFGQCGGCAYQHISYEEELSHKEKGLRELLTQAFSGEPVEIGPIVGSPQPYHYRIRLDLSLRRRKGAIRIGFQSPITRNLIEIEECPIARKEVSAAIPRIKEEAISKLPEDYRTANLVIKSSDDGRVHWGGIGRRSLSMNEEDYLWAEIRGKKIFHSLETFFQANSFILPAVMDQIEQWVSFDKNTLFWDLYAGVGLFGFCLAEHAGKVIMIEENPAALKLMEKNAFYHRMPQVECVAATVEDEFMKRVSHHTSFRQVAMVDPPRRGLSADAVKMLVQAKHLESLLYLSCHPESLVRDLKIFSDHGWQLKKIRPFDFFPRTAHLETLALLTP